MKKIVLTGLSIFIFYGNLIHAQDQKENFTTFSKKVKIEFNIQYKPFYQFGKMKHLSGTYFPIKFRQPITQTYEAGYEVRLNHFISEIYFKNGIMKYYLLFSENLDSSFSPLITHHHANALIFDKVNFYALGLRFGRVGKINQRFEYETLLGMKIEPNTIYGQNYSKTKLIPVTDTLSGNYYEVKRAEAYSQSWIDLHFETFDFTFKLKYHLTKHLLFNSSITYVENISRFFLKFDAAYLINYYFYSLNNSNAEISHGIAFSHFNQLHMGVGLSYLF